MDILVLHRRAMFRPLLQPLRVFFSADRFRFYGTRMVYDLVLGVMILALAASSRALLFILSPDTEHKASQLLQSYGDSFFQLSFTFVALILASNMLFGLYSTHRKKKRFLSYRISSILGASIITPALLFAITIFIDPHSGFSRGVLVFLSFYMFLFLYLPRLASVFLQNRALSSELVLNNTKKKKNILVIGGCGYIGSILVRKLLEKGYKVNVLDSMIFGKKSLEQLSNSSNSLKLIKGDFRNVQEVIRAMNGMSTVIHLGGIVGDPACSLDRDFTIDVNLSATTMLVECCKVMNIHQFLFASSCSVYGKSEDNSILKESSPLHPLSLYAETKIASEKILLENADENFHPVILRFATIFGISPRPRFDLVVNKLTAKAVCEKNFIAFQGKHFRPFVHVEDVAEVLLEVLERSVEKISAEIFNVGSDKENYSLKEVEEKIFHLVPGVKVEYKAGKHDERDYHVSFNKLKKKLGIEPKRSLEQGILEIKDVLESGSIDNPLSSSHTEYSNVGKTEEILNHHIYDLDKTHVPTHHKKTAKAILKEIS